jgi:hypothetical protein
MCFVSRQEKRRMNPVEVVLRKEERGEEGE